MGTTNKAANALSRVFEDEAVMCALTNDLSPVIISHTMCNFLRQLKEENASLQDLQRLHNQLALGRLSSDYVLKDGILFFKHMYYLSAQSALISSLLHEFNSSPMASYPRIKRTMARLAANFFGPKMCHTIHKFITEWCICQQTKYSTQAPSGLLQPLPIPAQLWKKS